MPEALHQVVPVVMLVDLVHPVAEVEAALHL
jgi:hypothetical protein